MGDVVTYQGYGYTEWRGMPAVVVRVRDSGDPLIKFWSQVEVHTHPDGYPLDESNVKLID